MLMASGVLRVAVCKLPVLIIKVELLPVLPGSCRIGLPGGLDLCIVLPVGRLRQLRLSLGTIDAGVRDGVVFGGAHLLGLSEDVIHVTLLELPDTSVLLGERLVALQNLSSVAPRVPELGGVPDAQVTKLTVALDVAGELRPVRLGGANLSAHRLLLRPFSSQKLQAHRSPGSDAGRLERRSGAKRLLGILGIHEDRPVHSQLHALASGLSVGFDSRGHRSHELVGHLGRGLAHSARPRPDWGSLGALVAQLRRLPLLRCTRKRAMRVAVQPAPPHIRLGPDANFAQVFRVLA
mmetsp:Transcript_9950/g.18061  ORF Transcript_9950/g.18061 Transcript_9950/m.18061 type:complete len:293 (-) Transcript_9950:1054-1932(-)